MSMKPTDDIRLIASEFNKRHGWDINAAISLAKEVLTDANAHQECRYLTHGKEMAGALGEVIHDSENLCWLDEEGEGFDDDGEPNEPCPSIYLSTLDTVKEALTKARGENT